jgi:hypothetical protein
VAKGYPDLGGDPVEGERFLDFLRFCVWVNGEMLRIINFTKLHNATPLPTTVGNYSFHFRCGNI